MRRKEKKKKRTEVAIEENMLCFYFSLVFYLTTNLHRILVFLKDLEYFY